MAIFRPGTNKAWAVFAGIYLAATLALTIYWLFTETGPVLSLAKWEAARFHGSWYPKITMLVIWVATLIPLLIVKFSIEAVTGKKLTAPITRDNLR
ncbi:MAG TPA: hypothetical protein VGM90_00645 [Kofleriaceae bacterium]